MKVAGFMVPVEKVVKCSEWDAIQSVVDMLVEKQISCIVVMGENEEPAGIVAKTDLVAAYKQGIPLAQHVGVIMNRDMKSVRDTDERAQAAKIFEHVPTHHALVLNKDGKFVGLISTWDIAADCARDFDHAAWPWPRSTDGYIDTATGVF